MKVYNLIVEQKLDITLEKAWDFFSSPKNLKLITPKHIGFDVINEPAEKMHGGMIIAYKLSPFKGYKTTWVTEITHVEEPNYFIDNQRFGPYSMWHHQHYFEEIEGGVLVKDVIHYVVPFGFLGQFANWLFVRKQLNGIFAFRKKVLRELFGEI